MMLFFSSAPPPPALAVPSQPPIDASPAALKEKREWLIASVARELEPAFRGHVRHLRWVSRVVRALWWLSESDARVDWS